MAVPPTSISLLSRCRDITDQEAWRELDRRYRELLLRFCRRRGLGHMEAEDVVQRVFLGLTRSLPAFVYDRERGRFRDYLFRAVRNSISLVIRCPNAGVGTVSLRDDFAEAPAADEVQAWEEEWVAHHYRRALAVIRVNLESHTIAVFERSLAGASIAELQAEFGLSDHAIYKIRHRIRTRLQELIQEQIREEDCIDGAASG